MTTPLREVPPLAIWMRCSTPHRPRSPSTCGSASATMRLFIAVGLVIVLFFTGWVIWRLNVRANANAADIDANEAQIAAQQELIDGLAVAVDEAISQGAAVQTPEEIAAEVPDAEVTPQQPRGRSWSDLALPDQRDRQA